jgi:hypothetical protein
MDPMTEIEMSDAVESGGEGGEIQMTTPIIIDLGKTKRKRIKRLKRGQGRLMDEVIDVLDEVAEELGEELDGKTLVPIVMIYQKKDGRKRSRIVLPF